MRDGAGLLNRQTVNQVRRVLRYLGDRFTRPEVLIGITEAAHSHSMVPGGLLVTSRATRFTPGTSRIKRFEMVSTRS